MLKKFLKALEQAETASAVSGQTLFEEFSKRYYHNPKEILDYLNKIKKTNKLHYDGVPISTPEDFNG